MKKPVSQLLINILLLAIPILIFSNASFSQVEIMEEIILTPQIENSSNLIATPFYGDVFIHYQSTVQRISATLTVGDRAKLLNEVYGMPNECNPNCVGPLWGLLADWTEHDIPALTPVSLEVLQCQQVTPPPPPNGTCDWVSLPVDLTPHPTVENRYKIAVDVNFPSTPPDWRDEGYITFTETTAMGCFSCVENPDGECQECIDNTDLLPEINLVQVPAGTDGLDPCAENSNNQAGFTISYFGLQNINFVLNACYNTQLQRWWFAIEGNNLDFKYVLEYCEQNIANMGATLIDDYEDFPLEYGCEAILRDLDIHYEYGKAPHPGGFVLKSMLEAHELQHYLDFVTVLEIEKEVFSLELLEVAPLCEEFNSVEEATNYWRVNPDLFGSLLLDFWDRAYNDREEYSSWSKYESQTHKKARRNMTQIKIDALCYWNCEDLLPSNVTCP